MTEPIPCPPSVPFLGHAKLLDPESPVHSFSILSKEYGEIYQFNLPGRSMIVISSQELLHEVSDDSRFRKSIRGPLSEVRNATGDGLFTAHVPGEENWDIAHRILMPAFSTMNIRNMFEDMVDVVSQLVLKWERFGPHYRIDPSQDFTALTLEAIALCSMSYRMNTFYTNGIHPFAETMADFLLESGARSRRPGIISPFMRGVNAKYEQDRDVLTKYVEDILEDRRAHPTDKNDILNLMMHGKDKTTGQGMSDDSIKHNLLTLLIAGHETTSGMLTFALYYLLKNPEAMRRLREEVDTMIGERPMSVDDLQKLPYLIAVMRETLRLSPTAPVRIISPLKDTTLQGGKYTVKKDELILCGIYMVHRDPKVWGDDAEEFKPERMLDGKFEALPLDSWQPFSVGMRACMGRAFAWQEAQIALVYLIQRFTFAMSDPLYDLRIKSTLTIKPREFYIHAIPRTDRRSVVPLLGTQSKAEKVVMNKTLVVVNTSDMRPMYVLYGSNMGTGEAFAQRIAADAGRQGFKADVGTLDSAANRVLTDGPVIIVTASYEGQPPDSAAHFVEWLSSLKGDELAGVSYAVFGCGNHDWALTYQRIPTLCDDLMAKRGGTRILFRGEGDAGSAEFFESFANWESALWEALGKRYGTLTSDTAKSGTQIQIRHTGTSRADVLRQPDTALGTVLENRVLTAPGTPVKRHIELQLPEGTTYSAGDYLAILPSNPPRDVRRALTRFGVLPEQEITIDSAGTTALPTGRPISVSALLSGYVELAQPATTRDLRILLDSTKLEAAKQALGDLLVRYAERVLVKRLSVLDILEEHSDIDITFTTFLQLLPSMRIRQYSISSSPLANATRASLTIRVFEAEPVPGRKTPFLGVASTYLGELCSGDRVQLAVRPSKAAFRLPADPMVPLIMCCAGSGLAPLRGFLQERAIQKKSGREVAKSILFIGCRKPTEDYLYSGTDLKTWVDLGIVDVRPAFSRATDQSSGCKYVQDRVWHDRADVVTAWNAGAKLYLCGSSKMAAGVTEKLVLVVQEELKLDHVAAVERFDSIMIGRFATDVFE